MQLSQKQKTFNQFFFFLIFQICIQFETFSIKKMTLISNVFPELRSLKKMVR